jgi:phosphohistidine phosphatase
MLRHAKSAYPDGVDDHDRPLNARGERDARRAGELLSESFTFDRVLVSTAVRAQQTWQLVARALAGTTAEELPGLYLASRGELLDIVRQLPAESGTALVVGHNEGLEECVSALCGVPTVLKTSTFAALTSPLAWGQWHWGTAHLEAVVAARG